MKKNSFILVFSFLFIFSVMIYSQSLTELEKKYDRLSFRYDYENQIVDSLKIVFSKKADQIDREKKKNNPDQDVIVNLMAGTTTTSGKLEYHNKKLKQVDTELENVKKQLHKIYVFKIDSLESLKKTGEGDENKLNEEIILLTAKNLLVAPRVLSFSFNPSKVLNIDLNKVADPKEKILYKEYLDNTYNEVNSLLEGIISQSNEVEAMVTLQNKTKKFLEEAELESKVFLQSQGNIASSNDRTPLYTGGTGIANESSEFSKQVHNYQLILRQLDIEQLSRKDFNWDITFNESNKNLSLKEYQSLLNEVKKRLQEYKLVLANKIGSSR